MQIPEYITDEKILVSLSVEAVRLLCSGDIQALVARFGYALTLGRESTVAVQQDLQGRLAELQASGLIFSINAPHVEVKYFQDNKTGLLALIECQTPSNSGGEVLVELVVSASDSEMHVTLEPLNVAA